MKFKPILLSIAIALIFVFFVGSGINVFTEEPNREDYCARDIYGIRNQTECVEAGGVWQDYEELQGEFERPVPKSGMCNEGKECHDTWTAANADHNKIIFMVAVFMGVIAIVIGFILKKDAVTDGLIGGGILSILYGTIRYWQDADELLKFVWLGLALAVVIWLGYKKLK